MPDQFHTKPRKSRQIRESMDIGLRGPQWGPLRFWGFLGLFGMEGYGPNHTTPGKYPTLGRTNGM